jgi:hypothetical protein
LASQLVGKLALREGPGLEDKDPTESSQTSESPRRVRVAPRARSGCGSSGGARMIGHSVPEMQP